ncbi:hypothetical protein JKP88DRAFT_271661 [Tribonema minus]|uniref:tRNA modification GTPase MnmE n=1 Tax=Tribonema minus TaxID=303371 RepID=A0A836CK05_9STRA|nr:hypothetical protein JKP88DRAFT_271661 [Tribonema minus]
MAADTIFALSSGPAGQAGVAVIRVSGPAAGDALHTLITAPGRHAKMPEARRAAVRRLYDPVKGDLLDEALVLWMPGPRSFTGEDTTELHTHGSRAVVGGVLGALGTIPGLRPAERGEFTQRAYGNGRMDLTEVEGLADLIAADTAEQRRQALRQMGGALKDKYESWREELTKCLAHTEAVIDFGDDEDDVDEGAYAAIRPKVSGLIQELRVHLADNRRGEIVRNGVRVAIAGPPNAGKSSLLNVLAERPAAIVSPIAGTTRDVVQLQLDIAGLPVVLSDTAGLRAAEAAADDVEREGIRRAREAVVDSQLTIFVWDSSNEAEGAAALKDLQATDEPADVGSVILVSNKADLGTSATQQEPMQAMVQAGQPVWQLSCKTGEGVEAFLRHLEDEIARRYQTQQGQEDAPLITRARHRHHVQACLSALEGSMDPSLPMDLAAEELRYASAELGRITGAVDVEELLDVIFRDFCIGK